MSDYVINNWVLKESIGEFRIADFNLKQKLAELCIPVKELETFIDWELVEPKYNFFYDYDGNEEEISDLLKKSFLNDYEKIYLDIGCDEPLIEINTDAFIDKWEDFVASNGYSGIFVFTNDGRYFMEFTDDAEYQLYSNFRIKDK